MPPHRPKYKDYWYADLPEEARKAATVLGWDCAEKWDQSVDVPYRAKTFDQLTMAEKRAAVFLQINLIAEKYDIYWAQCDDATKEAALALDWTEDKWDDDWELWDLEIDHKYWKELTDKEKSGAMHFGYTQHTWDEDSVLIFEPGDEPTPAAAAVATMAAVASPIKQATDTSSSSSGAKPAQDEGAGNGSKKKCLTTKMFGGNGGTAFDHGTNKGAIKKIAIYASRKSVEGLGITYEATRKMAVRNGTGTECESLELADGEYINKFTVRADDEVQCLTFFTNLGHQLGPCGGKGGGLLGAGLLGKGGEEVTLEAPSGMMMCGVKGQAGNRLDAIAIHWGPCP